MISSVSSFSKYVSLLAVVLVGSLAHNCFAQRAISETTLASLKGATVFVRVNQGNRASTGSGFLIGKTDDWGYIVTNEHVVRARGARGKKSRSVEVDFNSGSGNRKTFFARVVSEDKSRDLAVLKIKNKDLPKPIPLKSSNEIRETVTVHILGYPFGEALSTSRNGPNVTIGRGTISSMRKDDYGNLEEVQVDGDINPGNSGGPIVFEDGSLMGVSVATVRGTQIGIGIPGESVSEMLQGRVGGMEISQTKSGPKSMKLSFEAGLIDPLGKLKNVSVLYIEKKNLQDKIVEKNSRWSQLSSKMKEVKLEIDEQAATGEETITGENGSKLTFVQQIKFTNGEGETLHTPPRDFIVRIPRKPRKKKEGNDDDWIGGTKDKGDRQDDWIGADADKDSSKKTVIGKPVDSHRSVGGNEFTCVDAECSKLKIGDDELVLNIVWARDHESFFVLSKKGMLRKISFPGFLELKTLDFGAECSWIGLSKQGLCVLVEARQDLVVLDEKSLELKKKLPVGTAKQFGASPKSDFVFLSPERHQLLMGDLKAGKVLKKYEIGEFNSMQVDRHERAGRIGEVKMPTVSPDGETLFLVASGCLHKFAILEKEIVYEQASERIASNPSRVEVSADSKYVALPSGGGNGKRGYTTYVYKVSNVLKEVVEINGGAYPQALALDKPAGLIYSQGGGFELSTFSPNGEIQKKYDLDRRGSGTEQILVHPEGRKILVLHSRGITFVELPE